ncbi:MAG: pantetheine-phosphate adenylyltransferase [Bacteroidia bacterium]|nr:pantetheine-phosphate adenylyltransferase [Bacteroidia bacterium]
MERIAVFPGSFDPFTIGHEAIVKRALPLFEKIIIAIGHNKEKKCYFPLDKRVKWIKKVFKDELRVEVAVFEGLTIDFCHKRGVKYILRGLRTSTDFEYERMIAQTNKFMAPDIESVFLLTTPELTAIHSTTIRDILKHGGDVSRFVPKEIDLDSI